MSMFKSLGVMAAAALLTACATATPYQPIGAGSGSDGYAQTQIESNRFNVSFSGNSLTDRETVETYLLYRAAELTVQNGYDHFVTVNRETEEDRRLRPSMLHADPFYSGFACNYSYFSPRRGWIAPRYYRSRFPTRYRYGASRFGPRFYDPFYDPFGSSFTYDEITKYQANAEILMGYGPKPGDANAFNAQEVLNNLRSRVIFPDPDA